NGSTNTQCGGIIASVCGGNPFDPLCGSGYTQSRRSLCTDNPFAPRCAGEGYNDLRVSFCDKEANAGNPDCPQTPQVTAKVWADSFGTPLAHGVTATDTKSQFLIARETDLDNGGFSRRRGVYVPLSSNLNLADATFNGVALGGDRADGTAFDGFNNNRLIGYAGILSGTNLGAPLTDTEGSAKWIGSYRFGGSFPTDFVLNVSFGTGDGAGEIEAVMQKFFTYKGYDFDYHIAGEFDDTGVITGRAWRESYMTNDPNNRGSIYDATGTLTGLIGEEGAVGAFILNGAAGGFVARPPSEEELRTLEQTCADDPFHKLCVSQQYQQARANRKAFCRTAGNEGNALCTFNSTFAHICTHHPFDAQCLGDSDYTPFRRAACTDDPFATRCGGDVYNDLRVSFCDKAANAGNPACLTQVTAKVWADSFDEDLAHAPTAEDTESKFLIARATDLDTGEVSVGVPDYSRNYVNLNLADATFNGVALGGDRADGAAFFAFIRADDGLVYNYAGILEGTNLGAPLTDTSGS
ncbi:MAG: hypothetical protein K8953_10845, partial [Proteobacteria bacterium]|nr:hypothetical protein [Pseudomonadota bacterium]